MNMCLRFFTFTFLILPNLAKYMYRWSPLEQHHKIEKRKIRFFKPLNIFIKVTKPILLK
jgi:hypothetical protein